MLVFHRERLYALPAVVNRLEKSADFHAMIREVLVSLKCRAWGHPSQR